MGANDTKVGLFTIVYKKHDEGSIHCALQHTELWCSFCLISTFMLSCWLNLWLGQTLIKRYSMVCSVLLPLSAEGRAEFSTGLCGQWPRSGTDWGLNWQRLQKLPVHALTGGLAFFFPQAHQMPTISISTKSEPFVWRKEIIHGEGCTKDICPCFVSEGVQFFLQCQPSPWVLW